jgi:SAM-dependent methyltransferase
MKMKKVHEYMMIIGDSGVVLDGQSRPAKVGKHEIWIPPLPGEDFGMKVIWSFNGKIESYRDWAKGKNVLPITEQKFNDTEKGFDKDSRSSISNEYMLFATLGMGKLTPQVDGFFYIKNVLSYQPYGGGALNCDSKGMYGFYMQDANALPPGEFTKEKFQELVDIGTVILSNGAMGDVLKPDNLVNGYLVDVRRSLFDMMKIQGVGEFPDLWYEEDIETLKKTVQELGQFPHKSRKSNYQSYLLNGEYVEGSRNTLYRMKQMGILENLKGKTVLDLGCCHGAMSLECYNRGARKVSGLDHEKDYIFAARSLARANGFQINFLLFNLTDIDGLRVFCKDYYSQPIDIVFALSLYKHIPEYFEAVLRNIRWKVCYAESNNAPDDLETGHVKDMNAVFADLGCKVEQIGKTTDRSPRILWRLTNE